MPGRLALAAEPESITHTQFRAGMGAACSGPQHSQKEIFHDAYPFQGRSGGRAYPYCPVRRCGRGAAMRLYRREAEPGRPAILHADEQHPVRRVLHRRRRAYPAPGRRLAAGVQGGPGDGHGHHGHHLPPGAGRRGLQHGPHPADHQPSAAHRRPSADGAGLAAVRRKGPVPLV